MSIRDSLLALAPPWLSDPRDAGGKLLYTAGLLGDALIDKTEQALKARMPGLADPSALPLIGADRLMPRGPDETDAQYATRLRKAFPLWQEAGIDAGVLRQVLGYLEAFKPRARIVSDSAHWCSFRPDIEPSLPASYQFGSDPWDWDSQGDPHPVGPAAWWRWWMILYSTATSGASWAGDGGTWGAAGTAWGDTDRSWGLSVPSTTISAIRGIIGLSKRAGSWCRWLIISLDDTLFDPATTVLNGTLGHWGKTVGTEYVRARPSAARYCDGWASTGQTLQSAWPFH
jgi:hypothetical protein